MQTQNKIHDLRQSLKAVQAEGKTIALIPTMGNLHEGHLQLIRQARSHYDYLVCSIFVNPLQFGPDEDLDAYPKTPTEDCKKLEAAKCDCLFLPSVAEIYGENGKNLQQQTSVIVPGLTKTHCGSSRPGHFDGVATIVTKLFNIVKPDAAYFGLKDYQQFLVIQKLTHDLALDIDINGVETQRESTGLAMSSRNNYLSEEQKLNAASLYQCLSECAENIKQGNINYTELEKQAKERLLAKSLRPDYFSICNAKTLEAPTRQDQDLVILAAVYLGKSRLIDNIRISRKCPE